MSVGSHAFAFATGAALVAVGVWLPLSKAKQPVIEPPAKAERMPDGALALERRPDPAATPAHEIPKGATVERIVQVVVKPNNRLCAPITCSPVASNTAQTPTFVPTFKESLTVQDQPVVKESLTTEPPKQVTLDLALVRMPDGTRRVIASSPDGAVVGGVDVPVTAQGSTNLRSAAGGAYTLGGGYAAWYHRYYGDRWLVGAQVRYTPATAFETARLGADLLIGWRW